MTFGDLCAMEPRLRELENEARATGRSLRSADPCAAWYGYGAFFGRGLKERLVKLIGFHRCPVGFVEPPERTCPPNTLCVLTARDLSEDGDRYEEALSAFLRAIPEEQRQAELMLRDFRAYDVAYDHLLALLTPEEEKAPCLVATDR